MSLLDSSSSSGTAVSLFSFPNITQHDGIYIPDFSHDVFTEIFTVYGIPIVITLLCSSLILYETRFHLGLFPSWILRQWLGIERSLNPLSDSPAKEDEIKSKLAAGTGNIADNADATFEFYLSWMMPTAMLFVMLVPITILIFFIASLLLLDHMFACAMSYIFFFVMLLIWSMMRWKFEGWRYTLKVRILFLSCICLVIAFELYKTFYARPYTFIGLGVFALMCNMIGMMKLCYYLREYKQIQWNQYLDMDVPFVQQLKKNEEQMRMKIKMMEEEKEKEKMKKQREKIDAIANQIKLVNAEKEENSDSVDKKSQQMQITPREEDSQHLISSTTATTNNATPTPTASDNNNNNNNSHPTTTEFTTIAVKPASTTNNGNKDKSSSSSTTKSDVPQIDPSTLATHAHFQSRLSILRALASYCRAFLALIGYSLIIYFAGFGVVGFIIGAGVAWMDLVVFLWSYGSREGTPLQACLLLCTIRFFMIIFDSTYYLVGHAILFIVLSCYFSSILIDKFLPLSRLRILNDDEQDIVPEGIKPILHAPVTAVKDDLSTILDSTNSLNPRIKEAQEERKRRNMRWAAHGINQQNAKGSDKQEHTHAKKNEKADKQIQKYI